MSKICVTGAGGMIGGHMVNRLVAEGHDVVAVDIKKIWDWEQTNPDTHTVYSSFDVRDFNQAAICMKACDEVFAFACDMGGMGFISGNQRECLHSIDITSTSFRAAAAAGVSRFFQASSACIYPDYLQQTEEVSLKESDSWPWDPEPGYGLEKIYGEEFCRTYNEDGTFEARVARYHNIFGTSGTWTGGREKAPAAICRKVAEAVLSGDHKIDIWGDGEQTRSFLYVDDCIEGTLRLMRSDFTEPLNIGSDQFVSINHLVSIVGGIAGVRLERTYDLSAPQGVRGRNSDNTLSKEVLDWEPSISLQEGLEKLYPWVYDQVLATS